MKSDRHFTGTSEDVEREPEGSQVINTLHLLDFGLSRMLTKRVSAGLSLPVQFAERSSPIRDANRDVIDRDLQTANGIGDMSLLAQVWVLDPKVYMEGNIQFGVGVKFPTGDTDVRHQATIRSGNNYSRQERTVDQSITPGDGGFGTILTALMFRRIAERVTVFAEGRYLINPRETNGTPTFRGGSGEAIMSVPDSYLARIGAATPLKFFERIHPFFEKSPISFSLGGRIEGVPVHDLAGGSSGFRRPGYAISIEPGLAWVHGMHAFAVSTPVTLYRDRQKSLPDEQATPERHGDAAFADYMVLFSYTYRFGGSGVVAAEPAGAPAVQ